MIDKQELWMSVRPHVKAILGELLNKALHPALKEAVAKSENKIDDMVLSALEPLLLDALKGQIDRV